MMHRDDDSKSVTRSGHFVVSQQLLTASQLPQGFYFLSDSRSRVMLRLSIDGNRQGAIVL